MKKITLLLTFILTVVTGSYGQVNNYTFAQASGTYTPLAAPTVLATQTAATGTSAGALDDVIYSLPLPFAFTFSGVNYAMGTNINASSNGFVTFGATAPTTGNYVPVSSTGGYEGAISPFGLDCNGGYASLGTTASGSPVITITSGSGSQYEVGSLIAGTGIPAGSTVLSSTPTTVTISANCTSSGTGRTISGAMGRIGYQVLGTTPNQQLVIQYTKMRPYNVTLSTLDYQIVLHETTNVVDIIYGNVIGSAVAATPQIGLRGATNLIYSNRTSTTSWSATVAGAVNTATVTLSSTVSPASGQTYTWTPPVICTGTPVAGSVTPVNQNICTAVVPANLVASGFSTGVSGITFQWEESDDNGVGDAWANAVGGTGATTATYTPPAFSGTTIYYRLNVTCAGSGLSTQTASVTVAPSGNPTTQVTNLAMGTVTLTTIPLTWVNGNGSRRVVYFSTSSTFVDPVNGNAPALTAAAAYTGPGQQIVYDGTGTGVTVTGLVSGTTYYVKVYEYLRCGSGPYDFYFNVTTGTNILTVTPATPPVNDNMINALPILCGSNYAGNTTLASLDEDSAPDGFGTDMDARNVWYSFTGSGSAQTVTLNLCNSSYDTSVLVYTGTSGSLTLVAANDDDGTCGVGLTTRSRVSFTSDGTTTYYIAVEGYDPGSFGAFTMDVTCAVVNLPAVANQDCGTSLLVNVDGTDTNSDNSYATVSSAQPSCDLFGSIQDVWFSFVAPSSGTVDCLVTNGTMTSSNFAVYSGTCAGLTAVGTCYSNLTAPTTSSLTGLTSGATYYVQVWSNAAEQGTFTMKLSDASLVAPSFDKTGFSAYPNPVKDVLNLSYTSAMSNVSVHNLLGQTVLTKEINATSSQLDLSKLSNGTYLVKIAVGDLVKTIKIVKE